jgi:protein-S-isoprenylcysteine O-methyltransferase Ste14
MSMAWFGGIVLVGAMVLLAVTGTVFARRRVGVDVLKRNNEVAGFIYAVIGVLYAVLLGFTAIIVWEQFEKAQEDVDQEANELADLYRDAQTFPDETQRELEVHLRAYVRIVVEKEWAAMAEHKSSPEAWNEYNKLWRTYYEFKPQNDHERIWYEQSLMRLNQLGDQRRLRLLSSQSEGVPAVMWVVLLGAGVITIGFSFLFGTASAKAHVLMTSALALIIALVLFSVLAMEHPFSGITRVHPDALEQVAEIFDVWSQADAGQSR